MSDEEFELRELMRYRDFLVGQRTAMKNHDGEEAQGRKICAMQTRRARQLDKDIAALETETRKQVTQTETLREDIALPESIHGAGFTTAVTVRMELSDLRRFERARQLSAFAGLSPRQFESGTSVRKRTRMSEAGSKRVRKVLYMAACSAIAHPSARRSEYDSLKGNGENPWKASARSCEKYWSS